MQEFLLTQGELIQSLVGEIRDQGKCPLKPKGEGGKARNNEGSMKNGRQEARLQKRAMNK